VSASEEQALQLLDAGDIRGATTWVLRAYGAEVCGYVRSLLRNENDADDAFAQAAHLVFVNLGRFRREASLRTWFYTIARHAAHRQRRQQERLHQEPISDIAEAVAAAVRTATLEFQKSGVKDAIATLRASLSEEDRELLVLRVDRQLSWPEIAAILLGEAGPHSETELKREAARARKQFERAKERLRELAREAGLLG